MPSRKKNSSKAKSKKKGKDKKEVDIHKQFKPNKSPKGVFRSGAFGGTYFRPIHSSVTGLNYNGSLKEYPDDWFQGLNIKTKVQSPEYDKKINKYKVKCGSSLEDWESSNWIVKKDPYGWFQWYCRYYKGRRTKDDERQIKRWLNLAGPKGRFRRRLMNEVIKRGAKYNDHKVSPVIRQVLLHWGYELTKGDLDRYRKSR